MSSSRSPSPAPSLSIDIGQTERTLRALLEERLQDAGLSFPEWTALSVVRAAGLMSVPDLVQRQAQGRVASADAALAAVRQLQARALLSPSPDARLALTDQGEALYAPLAAAVSGASLWRRLAHITLPIMVGSVAMKPPKRFVARLAV